jgi:hypothetical protein
LLPLHSCSVDTPEKKGHYDNMLFVFSYV